MIFKPFECTRNSLSRIVKQISYIIKMKTNQVLEDQVKVQKIILQLNKTGLSYLKFNDFAEAIEYFKKAQKIISEELVIDSQNKKINQLAAVTFNNIACYYKKTKKPKVALKYLQKCLQIQIFKLNDWISIGSTHLNICVIYSYLKKHEEALTHVQLALNLLQKQNYQQSDASDQGKSYWNIKMLCLYNKAIEEEHLKQFNKSLESYKETKQLAKQYGAAHVGIIFSCDEAISRIQTEIASRKKQLINIFLKKRQNQELGHYDFMRRNINRTKNAIIKSRDFTTAHLVKQSRKIKLERIVTTSNKQSLADLYKLKNSSQGVMTKRQIYKNRTEQTQPSNI